MNKQELRKIFKERRRNLTSQQVEILSQKISQNFILNLLPKLPINSNSIFSLYLDSYKEVKTSSIAEHFFNNNIAFSYPKITELNSPLAFILSEKNQNFTKSNFFSKILEPKNGKNVIPDVLIVPLLAFDNNFFRLGMGGGFFDRSIESLHQHKRIITIGLAYDFQASEAFLPIEKTDQKLDFIVTQNNIFGCA